MLHFDVGIYNGEVLPALSFSTLVIDLHGSGCPLDYMSARLGQPSVQVLFIAKAALCATKPNWDDRRLQLDRIRALSSARQATESRIVGTDST